MRKRFDFISGVLRANLTEQLPFACVLCQALYPHTTSFIQTLSTSPLYIEEMEAQRSHVPRIWEPGCSIYSFVTSCQELLRPKDTSGSTHSPCPLGA